MAKRGGTKKEDAGTRALARARDALYETPPKAFTAARNEQTKLLAEAGHRAEASALKKARRCPPSVWVVNRLARDEPAVVIRLLEAGGQLRLAQRKALSGVGGDELREATAQMRSEVRAALPKLRKLLTEAGESTSATVMERARQTLLTASQGTDEVREALRAGRLNEDLSPAGFGEVAGLRLVRAKPPAASDAASRQHDRMEARARKAALKRASEVARRELARRQQDLSSAEAERDRLEKFAQAAEERARQVREKADTAARELEAATVAEREARRHAEAADAALKD